MRVISTWVERLCHGFVPLLSWHWEVSTILFFTIPPVLTYMITSIQAQCALRGVEESERKPPILPCWLPLVGHQLSFLWDTAGLDSTLNKYCVGHFPIRIRFWTTDMYFISGVHNRKMIWHHSKDFTARVPALVSFRSLFGMPESAVHFYESDDSGVGLHPHPASKTVEPEQRIFHLTHKTINDCLTGSHLTSMATCYQKILRKRISGLQASPDWTHLPCLLEFLQSEMFCAAVEAMCGEYFLALNPGFIKDFWALDRGAPYFLKQYPKWLIPTASRARDRCLEDVKRWHVYVKDRSSITTIDENSTQDPFYGTRLMRARQDYSSKLKSLDSGALASADLGLIWALNTNTIPAAFWMLAELAQSPPLLSRVREEVYASATSSSHPAFPEFDPVKLCSQPLLQSVFAETLRLRSAIFTLRCPQYEDFKAGGWIYPRDAKIVISSHMAHMDSSVWNTGPGSSHPVDEFWAERFLVHPDDPDSGPSKPGIGPSAARRTVPSTQRKSNEPRFSLEGVDGSWMPFGGGMKICPGRHFAKQEILVTVAMLLSAFDMELGAKRGSAPKVDMKYYGRGTLPPKGKVPFRMRRRRL